MAPSLKWYIPSEGIGESSSDPQHQQVHVGTLEPTAAAFLKQAHLSVVQALPVAGV